MPPRGPAQSTTTPVAAAPVAAALSNVAATTASPTPARQQAAYPVKRSALPPSVGGLTYAPEPEGGEFEKFADLDAGDYTFSAWVDSIIMWPDGAAVVWRCNAQVFGDGSMSKAGVYGRDIGWPQSPPPTMGPGTKGYPYWRRRLVTCYRDLGLREEADPANNFPGWEADANGSLVPPFYSFFTDTIGRAVVPIMFRIKVHVDKGYEGIPKVEGLADEQVARRRKRELPRCDRREEEGERRRDDRDDGVFPAHDERPVDTRGEQGHAGQPAELGRADDQGVGKARFGDVAPQRVGAVAVLDLTHHGGRAVLGQQLTQGVGEHVVHGLLS